MDINLVFPLDRKIDVNTKKSRIRGKGLKIILNS